MNSADLDLLNQLPRLWSTEAQETESIVLPARFYCRFHRLVWYPCERSNATLFGLTLKTVPEWRHFSVSELTAQYGGEPVVVDRLHRNAPVGEVSEIRAHMFDDLTPFVPSRPRVR